MTDTPIPEPASIITTPRYWRELADHEDRIRNHVLADDYRRLAAGMERSLSLRGPAGLTLAAMLNEVGT